MCPSFVSYSVTHPLHIQQINLVVHQLRPSQTLHPDEDGEQSQVVSDSLYGNSVEIAASNYLGGELAGCGGTGLMWVVLQNSLKLLSLW